VEPYLGDVRDVVRVLTPVAAGAGAWIEDKGATLAVHYRQAPDPVHARAVLEERGVPLVAEHGLESRFGRMVMEVRPPVPIDKGAAVRRLLRGRRIERSLYAGDDRTDIDAFRVVDVPVAVRSARGAARARGGRAPRRRRPRRRAGAARPPRRGVRPDRPISEGRGAA
jgi:trehalose-phosphatase